MNGAMTTRIRAWRLGDSAAIEPVMPELYASLRAIAHQRLRRESDAVAVDATELVHDALLRVMGTDKQFANRSHFLAVSALYMRSILTDRARAGRGANVTLAVGRGHEPAAPANDFDLLALDDALTQLQAEDERSAQALQMTVFAGMPREDIAAALDVSVATVDRDLRFARSWLQQALG